MLLAEMLVFGRAARGEVFAQGQVFDSWRLRGPDGLLWADALAMAAGDLAHPHRFHGAQAMGTVLLSGLAPGASLLAAGTVGVTLFGAGLACRRFRILALVGVACSLASTRMRRVSAGVAGAAAVAAFALPFKLNIVVAIAAAVALCLLLGLYWHFLEIINLKAH